MRLRLHPEDELPPRRPLVKQRLRPTERDWQPFCGDASPVKARLMPPGWGSGRQRFELEVKQP